MSTHATIPAPALIAEGRRVEIPTDYSKPRPNGHKNSRERVFVAGFDAAAAGRSIDEVPYASKGRGNTPFYDAWRDGWKAYTQTVAAVRAEREASA